MSASSPELLKADAEGIARAVAILGAGGLVAVPTETVYGLAADATDGRAVARIFAAKGRPAFNPLIVHVPDLAAAREIAEMTGPAEALAEAFWPGALTLVLPLRAGSGIAPLVSAGLPTVALRVPAHPVMQAVLRGLGRPVAAPSANLSGRISATTAGHVADGLGGAVDAILDAGPCAVGVESTILAPGPSGTRLLREGGLPREAVEAVAGPLTADLTPGRIEAPGQMERHYAPGVPLILGGPARKDEVSVGFGPGAADLTLSATGDLTEAAARLFSVLHDADALARARGARAIRVAEVPETGLGRAINDRLRRAAVPES
ncbi:L-threonylcarbamoyladenylate synthase [Roseicyclus sp.]|uniref:L-threonylcarbamoyladenylate synthase n=1 Tax=Roseicyclus sp. TaxID=1914329 RepID=UPI003FA116D7